MDKFSLPRVPVLELKKYIEDNELTDEYLEVQPNGLVGDVEVITTYECPLQIHGLTPYQAARVMLIADILTEELVNYINNQAKLIREDNEDSYSFFALLDKTLKERCEDEDEGNDEYLEEEEYDDDDDDDDDATVITLQLKDPKQIFVNIENILKKMGVES